MLKKSQKVAIYMEGNIYSEYGEKGKGGLRYLENKIVCVIDKKYSNTDVSDHYSNLKSVPVVYDLETAIKLGAEVLILGIAPSGGKVPSDWYPIIKMALSKGLSIINGLHDLLQNRFSNLISKKNQWIWDVRIPQFTPKIATAKAALLKNKRILFIGTDMAVGKMTAGLELYSYYLKNAKNVGFVATGQIGITVTGKGIPLDAFKVDHACGAVEKMVLDQEDKDVVIIEGQGSLLHPGSTATLPLMRGSCPTHLILCLRAEKQTLRSPEDIRIPDLKQFIQLNESLCSVFGTYPQAKVIGIAANTSTFTEEESISYVSAFEENLQIPVTDPIRFGMDKLVKAIDKH
mgnify:CR=1 FL=1